MLALGQAPQSSGHRVCMVAGANFADWIEARGVRAADTRVDVHALMEGPAAEKWVKQGTNPLVNTLIMKELIAQHGWAMMMDAWKAAEGAEVIITSVLSDVYGVSIAEKLGARQISAWVQPAMIATRSGAATYNAPLPNANSILNYWFSKTFVERFPWMMGGSLANRFRKEVLGLPPQTGVQNMARRRQMLVLLGYSRYVVPPPADWPPNLHTTGYWFLNAAQDWTPPPELVDFLESGEPPVCIGFGSMTGQDARPLTELLIDAVTRAKRRAVLLSGWAGIGEAERPSYIYCIESAPHDWLFPRMRAVVHHGGSGTTAASLRAGVPTVIVPHLGDQVFWGQRVESLGVGPKAIPRSKLSAERLAEAIRIAATDTRMAARAAALGAKIRSEDGIRNALELFER